MSEKNSSTIKLDKNSELRRAKRTKLFFVFLIFILLILGGVVGFLRKKEFQIATITISGTKSLNPDTILKSAQDYVSENYLIIIPKTNTLLLSKSELMYHILEQVPSIQEVAIAFTDKNTINISVVEKKPSYVWCNEKCYFVDDTGMIYEESPQFTTGVFLTFSGGTVPENPIKNHFVSGDQFQKILQLIQSLKDLDIEVLGMEIGEDTTIHIASIKSMPVGLKTSIMITSTETPQEISGALELLMNDKTFTEMVRTKGGSLQYIDIRFPDKIYYKFDTPATQVTSTPEPTTTNAKLLEKPE